MSQQVGEGVYDIRVMMAGGQVPVLNLTPFTTGLAWERNLDAHNTGSTQLGELDPRCCGIVNRIRPWLHELWIRRNGETVFNGPISINGINETGTVTAVGHSAWLEVRFVRDLINFSVANGGAAADVSVIVDAIIQSALRIADPNLLPFLDVRLCQTQQERYIDPTPVPRDLAWQDHLSQMVGTYVHMAVHGRSIIVWCKDECIFEMPDVSTRHASNRPFLVRDGRLFQTAAVVYNDKDDTDPIGGYAGGVHPQWGILVERKHVDVNVGSNASAAAGAATYVNRDVPATSGNNDEVRFELLCDAPVDMARSVPGSCFRVGYETCISQTLNCRLESIGATWSQTDGEKPYINFRERTEEAQVP